MIYTHVLRQGGAGTKARWIACSRETCSGGTSVMFLVRIVFLR